VKKLFLLFFLRKCRRRSSLFFSVDRVRIRSGVVNDRALLFDAFFEAAEKNGIASLLPPPPLSLFTSSFFFSALFHYSPPTRRAVPLPYFSKTQKREKATLSLLPLPPRDAARMISNRQPRIKKIISFFPP